MKKKKENNKREIKEKQDLVLSKSIRYIEIKILKMIFEKNDLIRISLKNLNLKFLIITLN
nr:hypothetical protein [Mycoplasmopsis bovis]